MKKNIEITSQLISLRNSIVEKIQSFPDIVCVGKLESDKRAKLSYLKHEMTLAYFKEQDNKIWYITISKKNLKILSILSQEIVKLANREKVQYLHLLFTTYLVHLSI